MRWWIEDFKGVASASVDVSPGAVTILSGVNSSGKSSLLQSLLLTAQSHYHRGAMVLNGPLTRLGSASDLVRSGARPEITKLGLSFSRDNRRYSGRRGRLQREMWAQFHLAPSPQGTTFALQELEVGWNGDERASRMVLNKTYARAGDVALIREARGEGDGTDYLHLKQAISQGTRTLRTYIAVVGLRPVEVVQVRAAEYVTRQYRGQLQTVFREFESDSDRLYESRYPPVISEFVELLSEAYAGIDGDLPSVIEELRTARSGNPYTFSPVWRNLSADQQGEYIEAAAIQRAKKPLIVVPLEHNVRGKYGFGSEGLLEDQLAETLGRAQLVLSSLGEALNSVTDRVQYLGPLRDEPRVVWNQWNELARGLPVGTRGEYSAVVLSRNGQKYISYVTPEKDQRSDRLIDAVNTWLSYLEIGDKVWAENLGKLGIGLEVEVNGHRRDLTSVGVGVSQALPIVVAVLAAPLNSLFLVEQPELHLHPAVQSRLADFILRARPDLAIVLETHSEALLTRVRRRISEDDVERAKVAVTFVESSRTGSLSRDLLFNQFGDLSDWPEGFLSGIGEDTAAIVEANLQRIRRLGKDA